MKIEPGKQRVVVIDEATGEEISRGVLQAMNYQVGLDRLTSESEVIVTADIPEMTLAKEADGA